MSGVVLDSWAVRAWVLWPWCAARGHQEVFWVDVKWNGVVTEKWGRCSCGRRGQRHPVPAGAGSSG